MIRLGSLAGYAFDGPRLLGGWTPPARAGVYAVLYRPEPANRPQRYAVIYVDHADDLAAEGFPFRHPRAPCWLSRAGSRWMIHIATYEVAGGGRPHREQIARELIAVYHPHCNAQRYTAAWHPTWIGTSTPDEEEPPAADRAGSE